MNDPGKYESVREKILNVARLAARPGHEGEGRAAKAKLDELLKKYKLTMEELSLSSVHRYVFQCMNQEEWLLLRQSAAFVLEVSSFAFVEKGCGIHTDLTAQQWIELAECYSYYKRVWKFEREALLQAFIEKHNLFDPNSKPIDPSMTGNGGCWTPQTVSRTDCWMPLGIARQVTWAVKRFSPVTRF